MKVFVIASVFIVALFSTIAYFVGFFGVVYSTKIELNKNNGYDVHIISVYKGSRIYSEWFFGVENPKFLVDSIKIKVEERAKMIP